MSKSSSIQSGGGQEKKKGRKPRKANEKELLLEHKEEITSLKVQKKIYENMNYLSNAEKSKFDDKFSKPKNKFVKTTYRAFSALWPLAGKVIAGDSESYRYLVESIRMHPDQETLKNMLVDANFTDCKYYDLLNGVCAIHIGFKPSM